MYQKHSIGKLGENLACSYLIRNNYKIIERNFYCRQGEIDIIAKDLSSNELVFFEVKTRSNFRFGHPVDAVDNNKQEHLKRACQYYIFKNYLYKFFIRIDVIEVFVKTDNFRINHIKQIF